ncbi:MAG: efflux RND transporter periplasmic adaptor subunit [Pseudomonadota bacterium]
MLNAENENVALVLGNASGPNRKPWIKRLLGWTIVLLLTAAAGFFFMTRDSQERVQYTTETALQGDLTIIAAATGTLEPTHQVDVGSELSGIVETVEVDYNGPVTKGQVLARLETSKFKAQVMKSGAALDSAKGKVIQVEATLSEARKNLERIRHARALTQNKSPSQEVLDSAEASFQRAEADLISAKAAVSEARATLESDEADLSKTVIRSPINGIVLTRSIDPGQTVAASLESPVLFSLAEDLTQMELHVDVDEADVSQVKEGQAATFSVDAYPDQTFPALVRQVRYGAQTTDGVVTYETVLSVDNSAMMLRPGMTATADMTVQRIDQALLVPNTALRFTPPATLTEKATSGTILSKLLPGPPQSKSSAKQADSSGDKRQSVWTMGENGQLAKIPIATGETDGTLTQVLSGAVTPGQRLVVGTVNGGKK